METDNENPIIQLVGLGKQSQTMNGPVTALEDINLRVRYGEVFGIIGLSGAGKSVLVRRISYLEVPTSGRVVSEGKSLSVMKDREKRLARQSMGMIFQQFNLLSQRDMLQGVCFPLEVTGVSKTGAKRRTKELLALVDLEDRTKVYPAQLSGGQEREVTIAKTIATSPKVLLYDEVINALDPSTTESTLELLKKINREMEITVIVITHETTIIEATCDRVATINHGHIVEAGDVSDIFSGPKSDIGRQLILGDVVKRNLSFGDSCQIRIILNGRGSSKLVTANMVLACKVPVDIIHVDTKNTEGKAIGQILIQLPEDDTDADRICNYLKATNVRLEEVR